MSTSANLDSLKLALKNAKHDTTRCNILNMMVEMEGDEELWPKYNEQLLKIANGGLASNPSKSLKQFYIKHQSYAFNNIGVLANGRGDIDEALLYYQKALKLQEEINDKLGIAASLNNIGFVYNHKGDILKALECYHRCLTLSEELNSKIGVATALNNLGLIYVGQGDMIKAIEYYEKSLKICREIDDVEGIGSALNNIGGAYDILNNMPKAIEYYKKALEVYKTTGDKRGISTGLNNIGMLHHNKFELKEALNYYEQALIIQQETEEKSGIAYTSSNIAGIKLQQGFMDEALKYATLSLNTALALGFPDNINKPAQILKHIYKKQNNYKKAFEMYQLEIKMRDSINNQETKKASIKRQFQYAYEKQAAQDSVRHAEEQKVKNAQLVAQEAQLNSEKTQRFVLYGGLILMLAGSGLVFNRFRLTQKQKKIIQLQKEEVGFAYDQLHSKNKEVMDSINYARRIQNSLMPTEKYISKVLEQNKK